MPPSDPTPSTERTYEVDLTNGRSFRITVPEGWKVTYGTLHAGQEKTPTGSSSGATLRFYESDAKQRAMFRNVIGFRDTSLPIQRRAVRYYGKEEWYEDDGSYTGEKALQVEKRWVDENDISYRPPESEGGLIKFGHGR